MQMEGQTRVQTAADGTQTVVRLGRQSELVVIAGGGRYYEGNARDQVFISDSDAVTLASANTTKGAAGTIKLINGFYNPTSSVANAVILKTVVATVSGTPAGGYFYNVQATPSLSSTPTGTIRNASLLGAGTGMIAETGVVITRTDAATTAYTQLAAVGGPTAVAATGSLETIVDEPSGLIIVPPGYVFGITATGAGTSHVVQSTIWWQEVPL